MTAYGTDQTPARGTDAYRWWLAGAHAEAQSRHDRRIPEYRQLYAYVDVLTSATQRPPNDNEARIAWLTFQVFALADAPLRARLHYAWHILRGGKYPTT
jgi:hypothetical protein